MELNKSSESLQSLDSPLETPNVKSDKPIDEIIEETIEIIKEMEKHQSLNHISHLKMVFKEKFLVETIIMLQN